MMLEEIICGTNFSFGLYPGLTGGAYNAISTYATDELKAAYLPRWWKASGVALCVSPNLKVEQTWVWYAPRRYRRTIVPIPAAAWLFGSGLLGLIGFSKLKKAA